MDRAPQRLTPIERLAFRRPGLPHALVHFSLTTTDLRLELAPGADLGDSVTLQFSAIYALYFDVYGTAADDLKLPWEVLGLDAVAIGNERWKFVLTTTTLEYGFEAGWPAINGCE